MSLVRDQSFQIDNIESNIECSVAYVQAGVAELKAANYMYPAQPRREKEGGRERMGQQRIDPLTLVDINLDKEEEG